MNRHLRFGLRLTTWTTSVILLGACGAASDTPAPVAQPPPSPAPPDDNASPVHIVSVDVYSADIGPVSGAEMRVWRVDAVSGRTFSVWDADLHSTDVNGSFSVAILTPEGRSTRFSMLAEKPGYVQPCAVRAEVPETVSLQVEMVATWVLDQFDPPRPQSGAGPWLTGTIFEMTPIGRQPIPAAQVRAAVESVSEPYSGTHDDIDLATTESDLGGGFFLCNLGPSVHLHVSKPGFRTRRIGPFDGMESRRVEIELERM